MMDSNLTDNKNKLVETDDVCNNGHHHGHEEHGSNGECNEHTHHRHFHEHNNDDNECGHDHNHSHSHDHDHHHVHNEGKMYDVPGFISLETHSHEGATVCSFEMMVGDDVKIGPADTDLIDEKINALTAWLEEYGAVIGHIKGYVKAPEENFTFSTTGSGISYGVHKSDRKKFAFAAIVIGIEEEQLKDKVVELFGCF